MTGGVAFLMMIAYWPGLDGAGTSARWAVFAATAWLLLRSTPFTVGHAALVAIIAWAAISLAWAPFTWDGVEALAELLMIAAAFWAGSARSDLRPMYVGLGLGLSISSSLAILQFFGVGIPGIAWQLQPSGLFVNKNMLAEIAALALAGIVAHRIWWLAPLVAPSLILPSSRGAMLAFVAAMVFAVPRWLSIAAAGMGALAVAYVGVHNPRSVSTRFSYWLDTIDGVTLAGHGAGQFWGVFPAYADPEVLARERPVNAHNDFLQAAFDLGIVGALAFVGLALLVFRGGDVASRAVLAAFLVEGLVGFPLHMAATAFLFAVVAGHLCGAGHQLRGTPDVRRARIRGGDPRAQHRAHHAGR